MVVVSRSSADIGYSEHLPDLAFFFCRYLYYCEWAKACSGGSLLGQYNESINKPCFRAIFITNAHLTEFRFHQNSNVL